MWVMWVNVGKFLKMMIIIDNIDIIMKIKNIENKISYINDKLFRIILFIK